MRSRSLALISALLALPACGGGTGGTSPASSSAVPAVAASPGGVEPTATATPIAGATMTPGAIVSPSPAVASPKPTTNPPSAGGLSSTQKIYVVNAVENTITIYAAGGSSASSATPIAVISGDKTGLSEPRAIAVGPSGKIYVANRSGGHAPADNVTVYPPNPSGSLNEAPIATIVGVGEERYLALDAAERLYMLNSTGQVSVFPANFNGDPALGDPSDPTKQARYAAIDGPISNAAAPNILSMAVDAKGTVFLGSIGSIYEFAPLSYGTYDEAPIAQISGSATQLADVTALQLDTSANLVATVFDSSGDPVYTFPGNPVGVVNEAPTSDFRTELTPASKSQTDNNVEGIDASGNLYVVNAYNTVLVYAPSHSATLEVQSPTRSITIGSDLYLPGIALTVH